MDLLPITYPQLKPDDASDWDDEQATRRQTVSRRGETVYYTYYHKHRKGYVRLE